MFNLSRIIVEANDTLEEEKAPKFVFILNKLFSRRHSKNYLHFTGNYQQIIMTDPTEEFVCKPPCLQTGRFK